MKIVTAANAAFKSILDLTFPVNRLFYHVILYDIGGLGQGIPFSVDVPADMKQPERNVGRSPYKPRLILDALLNHSYTRLVWMDADAWVIRPMPEIETNDYDVAVTMRRQKDRGRSDWPDVYGYLNAGVVFINPTLHAVKFLNAWIDEIPNTPSGSDQHALNNLVLKATDLTEYNRVFVSEGVRIKVLSTEEYNWCYLPEEPLPATKILHCKTDLRAHVDMAEWTQRKFL